ncbi:MAG: cell wall-binding repeat-containing protein, partial [Microcella sp.]|nr:cell wall-binding repeat-containing protein [Microcella sp.]
IQATVCVRAGDSGGPAVVGSRAVGITSASNRKEGACSLSNNLGVFATLYSSNPAWEQVTKIYPDWEPLIGVSRPTFGGTAGRVNPNVSAIAGTLPNGSVRHTIELSINGQAQSRPVSSAGAWSLPTAGLPLGGIEWQARALWGEGSKSTLATGEFLRAHETRLAGAGRFATAQEISKAAFTTPGVDVVYIANGLNFPDALGAGPAATLNGGPLLLTLSNSLPAETVAELNRLQPARIVVVGSPVVVSTAVEQQLAANWAGGNVDRVGGASRYETGRAIIADAFVAEGVKVNEVFVATGANYADALSAGAAAAAKGVPIVLVPGTSGAIDSATRTLLQQLLLPNSTVYIAGGTNVVSSGIAQSINTITQVSSVQRLSGTSRFATSLAINAKVYPASGSDATEAFLAYGLNFPDALAGGVLAGVKQGPLYITLQNCVDSGMVAHMIDIGIEKVTLFGSSSVITNNVRDLVRC